MASNRAIFTASLLYSLILVLNYSSSSISQLIRITHLLTSNSDQTPTDYSPTIYSNVMKCVFIYSIATVFLSTAAISASHSSIRQLPTAISRHPKPFLAAAAAAALFPAVLRPPSMPEAPFVTYYFYVTLIHAVFVVYSSAKLVALPVLEEKFGEEGATIPKGLSWKFVVCFALLGIVQIVTAFLGKEAYTLQLGFGIVWEVMQMIWLVSAFELMVFTVLIHEKNKKKKMKLAGDRSEEVKSSEVKLAKV